MLQKERNLYNLLLFVNIYLFLIFVLFIINLYVYDSQNIRNSKMNPIIKNLEAEYTTRELPEMNPGDTVKVFCKIVEGNKERIQAYEGAIIAEHGSGINKTITVRKVFQGVGVERVFLVHSPRIEKIQVLRRGDVRRAKLYYLRERSGKATRIKEKIEKR